MPTRLSYQSQLTYLQNRVADLRFPPAPEKFTRSEEIAMLLSLSESVKEAQDHHMNCQRGSKGADQG